EVLGGLRPLAAGEPLAEVGLDQRRQDADRPARPLLAPEGAEVGPPALPLRLEPAHGLIRLLRPAFGAGRTESDAHDHPLRPPGAPRPGAGAGQCVRPDARTYESCSPLKNRWTFRRFHPVCSAISLQL